MGTLIVKIYKSNSKIKIEMMQLFVNCPEGETFTIDAESDWTVSDLKDQITLETGLQYNAQNLIVGGKVLAEKIELADFGLENESSIELLINLQGGASSLLDPAIAELSKKYNINKKICRKCYATLPPRALKCRKRSCGHWPDIRMRKVIKLK